MEKSLFQVFQVERLALLDQWVDDIGLSPGTDLFPDKLIERPPVLVVPMHRLYRLTAGRQLVDNGEIEVAIKRHGQRSGNRGSRHHQHMWRMFAFRPELCTLCHPETVLLVDHHKTEVPELHLILNEGMSPDKGYRCRRSATRHGSPVALSFSSIPSTGAHVDLQLESNREKVSNVCRQDLGRSHQARLKTYVHGNQHTRPLLKSVFPLPHPLEPSVHLAPAKRVSLPYLLDHPFLYFSKFKGECFR